MAMAERLARFEQTDRVSAQIIKAEAASRDAKTERLRRARLQKIKEDAVIKK